MPLSPNFRSCLRTSTLVAVSCLVGLASVMTEPALAEPTPAAAPAASAPVPAAPQVTDDIVSGEAPPPAPTPEQKPKAPRIQLDPAIDYGTPGAPSLPVLPGARIINPADVYILPPAEKDAAEVIMPGTPGLPAGNATLPAVNGSLPGTVLVPQSNATIVPLVPGFNATQPITPVITPVEPEKSPAVTYLPKTPAPQTNATHPLSPADFLVKTSEKATPEPPKKPELAKQPEKKPEKKPEPPTQTAEKPRSGRAMRIPPGAAQKGDLSFLEGCWKGTRPEYHSKRIINERFCFDASGVGKRTIADPNAAGMCYGPTKAAINKDGVLKMVSGQAPCTGGEIWGESEMICKGEGEQTPCYWQFPGINKNASQSYKIKFVRE